MRPICDVTNVETSSGSLANDRAVTAQIAQTLLFILCILLSGMLLSQLIEEKSNKIIEVIAAAIPIDAMFVGKLFAMLAASVTGLVVWVSAGAVLVQMIKHGGVATLLRRPWAGRRSWCSAIVYFGMNYLLLGAAFLTIGAQASTAREVQTMSMPVTFGQMLLLLLRLHGDRSAGFSRRDHRRCVSFVVAADDVARAAEQPELWPHLVALAVAGVVGGHHPARRLAAVPQDGAEVGAAQPMVEVRSSLVDRRARHLVECGHQRAVRKRAMADPRDPGLGPDFLVRRSRESDDVQRQRHLADHPLDLLRVCKPGNEEAARAGIREGFPALDHLSTSASS